MARELNQPPQDSRVVPVFRESLPDPISLALQLKSQGRVDTFGAGGRLYLLLYEPDGPVWFLQCPVCHTWSSECLSFADAQQTRCGLCDEQRLAESRAARVLARLEAMRHGLSVPQPPSRNATPSSWR